MSGADNNFRYTYYHKLGSTTAVEEKKNLTRLLSIVPLDIRKLEQFCHHLHVPNDLRCELWKALLRISPIYMSANNYVAAQRLEHFTELARIAEKMQPTAEEQQKKELYKYVAMYLIESRSFILSFEHILELEDAVLFYDIAKSVSQMGFNSCDTYWISRNFTNLMKQRVHRHIPRLIEQTHLNLQREDFEGKICEHLHRVGAYDKIPYGDWFANCFARVLPETTFERVWDKVISGSAVVLVFIAVAILLVNKRPILVMKTVQEILSIFDQIKTDTADEIVRRGIDLWLKNGGKLTPSSARASPAVNFEQSQTIIPFNASHF